MPSFDLNQPFCRVCMAIGSKYVNFEMTVDNGTSFITYLDCFEFVTRIKIDSTGNLQQYFCTKCADELKNAFQFIRRAESAEKDLREYVENIDRSSEQDFCDFVEDIMCDMNSETENDNTISSDLYALDDEENSTKSDLGTEKSFHCKECIRDFKNYRSFYQHRQSFHNLQKNSEQSEQQEQIQYRCQTCSKTYKSLLLLKSHLRYHDRKEISKTSEACGICGKKFSTEYYLRQHTDLAHTDKRPEFSCDQCNKIYRSKNALQNHRRIHSGNTVECSECGKTFRNSYDLKIHLRFHSRDYPFQCKMCDSKFAIKGHLRTHMWKHQGLKLKCENCEKLFTTTKALLEHSFTHAKEMPYPCCYCSKGCPSKQKYKVHLKTVHMIDFDEKKHLKAVSTSKVTVPKKKFTLVKAETVTKEKAKLEDKENENLEE